MSIDATKTIVPGKGTLFIAPVNTAVPATPLSAFSLIGTPPNGWENLGHTSKSNLPAFNREGGDKTVLDSWLADAIDAIYSSENWSLNINPIQVDSNAMSLGYGGSYDTDNGYIVPGSNQGTPKALFLLATDGTGKLGFYIPNTLVTLASAPSFDASAFFETPLTAAILAADAAQIPASNGTPGIMKVYKTGMTAIAPVVTTALPTAVAQNGFVEIVGTGFTGVAGAAGVKFGATNATSYTVISDTLIYAKMPAGSAGSAAVTVTHPTTGASNVLAYTRGA